MKVLVTGVAGFIGFHTAKKLLQNDFEVVGIDNLNDYYDPAMKLARLKELGVNDDLEKSRTYPNFRFKKLDIADSGALEALFKKNKFDYVINLAAQVGVRYSLTNPSSYIERNINGFFNLLEMLKVHSVKHLVFASSSSVYGLNTKYPFSENDNTDHPASLYAATKKMNELMAHTYSNLFDIPVTGLRFFTVYGPWGRPDMMPFILAESIADDRPVNLYDNGELWRDYTYVDDIVEGIFRILLIPPEKNKNWNSENPRSSDSTAAYRILNVGNSTPVKNLDFVRAIEKALNKTAILKNVPAPKTEVFKTYADVSLLESLIDYKPKVDIHQGVKNFIEWYKTYRNMKDTL
jgi:UDP-glucuronate 4-epimerase